MSRSTAALLLALALASSAGPGCRSFQGNLLRRDVAQADPRPEQPDPRELVRRVSLEHERRAQLVRSLKVSDLNLTVDTYTDPSGRDRSLLLGGTAGGVLVMERPRNLRLLLRKPLGMSLADIGSNDQEFWFANDQMREIVIGDYSQAGAMADPLLASMRPGWIFEILGLEPIPDDVRIEPGASEATLTLVEDRSLPGGKKLVKESILSVAEQRIVEHRLYSEGRGELIAQARVDQPIAVALGPASGDEPAPKIQLPRVVQLTIPRVAELRMELGGVEPNPPMDFASLSSFERPEKQGYDQFGLLDLSDNPQGTTLADASLPPPPAVPAPAPEDTPGSLSLPRSSDGAVARAERTSAGTDRAILPASDPAPVGRPVASDLPSPSRIPTIEYSRSSWQTVRGGNRFPRGVLGRE